MAFVKNKRNPHRRKKSKVKSNGKDKEPIQKNWLPTERIAFLELELRNTIFVKDQYKASLDFLQQQNEQLLLDLEESEISRQDMAKYLYESEQKHEETILKFYTDFNNLKRTIDDERRALQEQSALEQEQFNKTQEEHEINMAMMQQELHKFKHFDTERLLILKKLDELRETVLDVTKDHQDVIEKLEQRFMREKRRLEECAEERLKEFAKDAYGRAICNLSRRTLRVFNENIQLMASVKGMLENNLLLCSRLEEAKMAVVRAECDMEARRQLVSRLMERHRKTVGRVKELENENADYRLRLVAQIERFERERETLITQQYQGRLELDGRLRCLEAAVEEREHLVRRVATTARNVLEQRSDVETYLSNAIQFVKQQLRGDRSSMALSLKSPVVLDRLTDTDWDRLSWQDREKVLRYLFLQVRMGGPDRPPRRLPPRRPKRVQQPPACERWHLAVAALPEREDVSTQTDAEPDVEATVLAAVPLVGDRDDSSSLEVQVSSTHTLVASLVAEVCSRV